MTSRYERRAKAGGRKSLSSRLGFRYGRSNSAVSASASASTPVNTKPTTVLGSANNLLERNAAATSGDSETSASTLESSPTALRENQPPRETRSFTFAGGGDAHDRCLLAIGGDEAPAATGAGAVEQIQVGFEKDEFASTGGKPLGLTISPAKGGGDGEESLGAKIDQLPKRAGEGTRAETGAGAGEEEDWQTSLQPGDLLADINGQDVRRLPFSEVLRLLNASTPHVITTTCNNASTAVGSMLGSSSSKSNSIGSSRPHPHPPHAGNAAKKLRGTPSAASVAPRTPGSSSKTAPPSTNRSMAAPPLTPPSPAVPPLSPRRISSIRNLTSRAFPPLLTDVRRVYWRRKGSSEWGGGKEANGNGKDKPNGQEVDERATSAALFSSPAATPNSLSSSSFTRAARLNPWGGGTPGAKPGRLTRTRSMLSSTFGKLSPRATIPRRPAVPAFNATGNGDGGGYAAPPAASGAAPAIPSPGSPGSPAAAPPSPAGSSPSVKGKGSDASPPGEDVSAVPSTSSSESVRYPASSSPTTPRTSRQELVGLGAAAAANRRGHKLRFPVKLEGDEDEGICSEEREKDKANDKKMSRQLSRESMLSSAAAFFPSDDDSDDFDDSDDSEAEDEGHECNSDKDRRRGHAGGDEEGQPVRSYTADKSKVGGSSNEQPPQEVEVEVEVEKEVPLREQEEEEIVALSSYLASARRGWPWTGQDVLWAEYVSLNGHHRWIRSEQCRHALLIVPEALYLLELPKDAAARHKAKGPPTSAVGSWYMQLNASDVSHLSVPLTPAQPGRTACADRFEAGSGLVLHKCGGEGACAWMECRNAASRDALVDLVRGWAKPEAIGNGKGKGTGKERPLRVELRSVGQLASLFAGGDRKGRKIPSLTDERQPCPFW